MTSAVDLQQKGPEEDGKCQNQILLRLNLGLKVSDNQNYVIALITVPSYTIPPQ